MSKTKFEVYKDGKGNYRWRLLAQNGEPVASSGEGFSEKRTAMNAVRKLKEWSSTENIVDLEKIKEENLKAKMSGKAKTKKVSAKPASKAKSAVKKATPKAVSTKKSKSKAPVKKLETKVTDSKEPISIVKTVL